MKPTISLTAVCLVLTTLPAQQSPIYRVTVIERTTKAVNYQYRTGPTQLDFRGTVLMTDAKGHASVEAKRGRTEIDSKFDDVAPPARFGPAYLTYVLWAISPEGRPHNLGEVVTDRYGKARLHATTDLQAFGMIVTAEPYSAVRTPSDLVVMENYIRNGTAGRISDIRVKHELMPRGAYTWEMSPGVESSFSRARDLPMNIYEATSQLYQAQNAIGIARAANADRYAPETFARAQYLADEARRLQDVRADTRLVVQTSREAMHSAEDARLITERRREAEKLASAQADVAVAQQARTQAEGEAQRARFEADVKQAQIDEERAARLRAEAEAAALRDRATQAEAAAVQTKAVVPDVRQQNGDRMQKTALRIQLLERLNSVLTTRDTPRGLVATIRDAGFTGTMPRGMTSDQVARIAAIVAAQPGLRVDVEGHTDTAASDNLARMRAAAVRDTLVRFGLPAHTVSALGFGNSRPIVSNASGAGREENRRVEIVISGDPIGNLPFWDRTYTLSLR